MAIDTVALLRRDLDTYVVRTSTESARLVNQHNQIALEGHTSLMSISQEGMFQWIKEKLVAIGRKFVIIVNKLVARFSKNREKIEANIKEYQKNPEARVTLPASPKTITLTIAATTAVAAAIVTIIKLRKSENSKEKIRKVWDSMEEKLKAIKEKFRKEKKESKKDETEVSAKEAEDLARKAAEANRKAEEATKGAAKNMSSDTNGKSPEDVAGAGEAARAVSDLAEEAGQTGAAMSNKPEVSSKSNTEDKLKSAKELVNATVDRATNGDYKDNPKVKKVLEELKSKVASAKTTEEVDNLREEYNKRAKEVESDTQIDYSNQKEKSDSDNKLSTSNKKKIDATVDKAAGVIADAVDELKERQDWKNLKRPVRSKIYSIQSKCFDDMREVAITLSDKYVKYHNGKEIPASELKSFENELLRIARKGQDEIKSKMSASNSAEQKMNDGNTTSENNNSKSDKGSKPEETGKDKDIAIVRENHKKVLPVLKEVTNAFHEAMDELRDHEDFKSMNEKDQATVRKLDSEGTRAINKVCSNLQKKHGLGKTTTEISDSELKKLRQDMLKVGQKFQDDAEAILDKAKGK